MCVRANAFVRMDVVHLPIYEHAHALKHSSDVRFVVDNSEYAPVNVRNALIKYK